MLPWCSLNMKFVRDSHALERPLFGAKSMPGGFVHEHSAQGLQLLLVQSRRANAPGHGSQRVDAALIEHCLPGVRGLARHAHRLRSLRRCVARQQHPPRAQTPAHRLGKPLRHHAIHRLLAKYR
jgi:hypothetical protein